MVHPTQLTPFFSSLVDPLPSPTSILAAPQHTLCRQIASSMSEHTKAENGGFQGGVPTQRAVTREYRARCRSLFKGLLEAHGAVLSVLRQTQKARLLRDKESGAERTRADGQTGIGYSSADEYFMRPFRGLGGSEEQGRTSQPPPSSSSSFLLNNKPVRGDDDAQRRRSA